MLCAVKKGADAVSRITQGRRSPKLARVRFCNTGVRLHDCIGDFSGSRAPPGSRTLGAWMPKKVEVGNKFAILAFEQDYHEEEVDLLEENDYEVELPIDSEAAKHVWPRKKC